MPNDRVPRRQIASNLMAHITSLEEELRRAKDLRSIIREVLEQRQPQPLFEGDVTGAQGGVVDILVDRDTERYPNLGDHVVVYPASARPATPTGNDHG